MNLIAPHIEAFLREHLGHHRGASPHTCDSYAYSFQLLFEFAAKRLKLAPSALMLERLDAELISTFLQNLEDVRRNSPETRNIRLAVSSALSFTSWNIANQPHWNRFAVSWPFLTRRPTLV